MRNQILLTVAVLTTACGEPRRPFPLPQLPNSLDGAPRVEGMPIFTLAAGGWVLFGNKRVSYDAIETELEALSPAPKVVGLRIHAAEPWIHVQWAVAAIAERDIRAARLIYRGGAGAERDLDVTVWPSILGCLLPDLPEKDSLLLQIAIGSGGTYRCGDRAATDVSGLDVWLAEGRARVKRDDLIELGVTLWPRKQTPWGAVADAFAHVRAAGVPVSFYGYTSDRNPKLDEQFFADYRIGGVYVTRLVRSPFTFSPEDVVSDEEEMEEEPGMEEVEAVEEEEIIRDPEPPFPEDD